jgi:NAD(P)-dependent dehydrogenase (short-subunit alcohol dehydrogenase family)
LRLAHAGATVWISGRHPDPLEQTASQHPNLNFHIGDVTDPASCQEMVEIAQNPQIVVANAGAARAQPFHKMQIHDVNEMLSVNFLGVFNTFSAALPAMRPSGYGRLIAIASTAGQKGYAYVSAYCAAKHAVVGLTRSLAIELAGTQITANAICPGFTQTPMLEKSVQDIMSSTGRDRQSALDALTSHNPQRRLVQPGEIADAALWLAGPNSGAITGQSISISGGEVT